MLDLDVSNEIQIRILSAPPPQGELPRIDLFEWMGLAGTCESLWWPRGMGKMGWRVRAKEEVPRQAATAADQEDGKEP